MDEEPEEKLVQKNVRFTESLWNRLAAVVPERGRSKFIREAIEQRLRPIEERREVVELRQRVEDLERRARGDSHG